MIECFIPKYRGVCNVERNFASYFKLLLNKCLSIFKWSNLPDSIDERFLNLQLVMNGKCVWFKDNDKLYALNGNVGGEPNVYYEPTIAIIANPILGSKQLKVRNKDGSTNIDDLDGILMALTDFDYEADAQIHGGLYDVIYKYAGLLADNDVSINCAQLNGRLSVLFTADDEALARTAEVVLKEIYEGKPYKILAQDIVEKLSINPVAAAGTNNTIMSLIEAHAYILQNFYAEIGIASQGNLKRERVNTAETELMTGCLDINIYNMLKNLRDAVALINEKFNTEISVELNPEVFYVGSQNATMGQEVQIEETEEIKEEIGAVSPTATTTDADGELQTDGIREDKDSTDEVAQPVEVRELEAAKEEKAVEELKAEIKEDDVND